MSSSQRNLAIAGGKPVRRGSFSPWPITDEREKQHLMVVLKGNRLSTYVLTNRSLPGTEEQGDKLTALQTRFNEYLGVKHGIPVINGTTALDVACRSLMMDPGEGSSAIRRCECLCEHNSSWKNIGLSSAPSVLTGWISTHLGIRWRRRFTGLSNGDLIDDGLQTNGLTDGTIGLLVGGKSCNSQLILAHYQQAQCFYS